MLKKDQENLDFEVLFSDLESEGQLFDASELNSYLEAQAEQKQAILAAEPVTKEKEPITLNKELITPKEVEKSSFDSTKEQLSPEKESFWKKFAAPSVKVAALAIGIYLTLTAPAQLMKAQYFLANLGGQEVEDNYSPNIQTPNLSFAYSISSALNQGFFGTPTAFAEGEVLLQKLKNAPKGLSENSLVIPKINAIAPIMWNGGSSEDEMMDALRDGVAHYNFTSTPNSEEGNVFISGHSSYYPWDNGKYKTIFALLGKLQDGDRAYIQYDNKIFVYQMSGRTVVKPENVDITNHTDKPTLSLMTCDPVGTFINRLVVQFDLVGVYRA